MKCKNKLKKSKKLKTKNNKIKKYGRPAFNNVFTDKLAAKKRPSIEFIFLYFFWGISAPRGASLFLLPARARFLATADDC